jgi:hypothetical protein
LLSIDHLKFKAQQLKIKKKQNFSVLNNPWPCFEQLDTVTETKSAHKCISVFYILNIAVILHVSATSYPTFVIHFPEGGNKADRNM